MRRKVALLWQHFTLGLRTLFHPEHLAEIGESLASAIASMRARAEWYATHPVRR